MKPSRINRVMQILTSLQSGRSYTADDLASIFGKSRRTIFRDLKELHSIGVAYHCDCKRGRYSLDPGFFLPPVNLNLQESLCLLFLLRKVGRLPGMPFKTATLLAGLKIENNLPGDTKKYCENILKNMSIHGSAAMQTRQNDQIFEQLQKAIASKHKVRVRHRLERGGGEVDMEMRPYHLFYSVGQWHLAGRCCRHKKIHIFKLNRIREVSLLEKRFVEENRFELDEYFGKAWTMRPEGRLYNVKLWFSAEVAEDVADIQWHSTQKVKYKEDGSAIFEFRVDGLGEIVWWILSFGDQVAVLSPKVLRQRVIEVAGNVVVAHENI